MSLIQHSRGLAFDDAFASGVEHVPRLWLKEIEETDEATSRPRIGPLLRRQQFTIILLAPFALLLTVFFRQVVGIESVGSPSERPYHADRPESGQLGTFQTPKM